MIQIENVKIGKNSYQFMKMEMGKAPLVVLKGEKGYVMCGYLNLASAEKLGDIGVRVTGVSDIKSVLDNKVLECTSEASKLGIKPGDRIADIIALL